MKNIFRFVMAVAILFGAASCQKDAVAELAKGEVTVSFTANLADLGTRAAEYGDGTTVNVVYLAVYEPGDTTYLASSRLNGAPVTKGKATIDVVLLKDKVYDLVFWAQNTDTDAYTPEWNNRKIVVNYDNKAANDENRDAFFLVRNGYQAGHDETSFTLRRPFAQINVGNTDADVQNIANNGANVNGTKIVESSFTVETKILNTLDLSTKGLKGTEVTAEFTMNEIPKGKIKGTEYNYLAMNYLLVNDEQLVDVTFKATDNDGVDYTRNYYQIPVKRNWRTNIVGQIISSPYKFNVTIDPIFKGDYEEEYKPIADGITKDANGVYHITNGNGLAYAAANLFKTDNTFNIATDIDMTGINYAPVSGSGIVTIEGNNKTISNLVMNGVTQAALLGDTNKFNVKDLTIANSTFVGKNEDGEDSAAAFVGFVEIHSDYESKLTNCHVDNCTIGSAKYVGGLIAYKSGGKFSATNCSVKNSTIVSQYTEDNGASYKGHAGGLLGYGTPIYQLTNCVVEGNTFDVNGPRCGLFIGSANSGDATVSGAATDNTGCSVLAGQYNYITDWSNVQLTCLVSTVAALRAALALGADVTMDSNMTIYPNYGIYTENGYGSGQTGFNQQNGGVLNGGNNNLWVYTRTSGSGCDYDSAIVTSGGTIKNIKITYCNRGIIIVGGANASKVILDNVVMAADANMIYNIWCDGGSGNGLEATNCKLYGFTSYAASLGDVTFTGCEFGELTKYGHKTCKPFAPTAFVNCQFEAGFTVDNQAACTFQGCTLDGVALDSTNIANLVTDTAKATIL